VFINIQEGKTVFLKAIKQACPVFLSFFLSFCGAGHFGEICSARELHQNQRKK
jgi:hypothetical protein